MRAFLFVSALVASINAFATPQAVAASQPKAAGLEFVTGNRNLVVTNVDCQTGFTHGIPNSTIGYTIGRLNNYVYANKDVCDELSQRLRAAPAALRVTLYDAGGIIVGFAVSDDDSRDYPTERGFFSREWMRDSLRTQQNKK